MSAQGEAMERAKELLGEHFDSFVIVALCEEVDRSEDVRFELGGSIHAGIGLLERAKHELLSNQSSREGLDS